VLVQTVRKREGYERGKFADLVGLRTRTARLGSYLRTKPSPATTEGFLISRGHDSVRVGFCCRAETFSGSDSAGYPETTRGI